MVFLAFVVVPLEEFMEVLRAGEIQNPLWMIVCELLWFWQETYHVQELRSVGELFHHPVYLWAQMKKYQQDLKVCQIFDEKLTDAQDTHRYLVFIVEEHVNSFLCKYKK